MKYKIGIIDDEEKITEVLESYFLKEGFEVYKALNGKSGMEIIEKNYPDILIVDLMLPDISGELICQEIRKNSDIPIIMLTAKSSEDDVINGIDIGADDYITKPFSPREVVARAKALLRRSKGSFNETIIFNNGELEINFTDKSVKLNGEKVNLTGAEFKVLEVLAKRPNRVFSREDILNFAFGNSYDVFDRTIDTHIKNLRAKIEIDKKNPKYILTVFGMGYRFGGNKNE